MALCVPEFDGDGQRVPSRIKPPAVIDAKAAGFEADRGGGGCDLVGLDCQFHTFEALDIGPAPKQDGCTHVRAPSLPPLSYARQGSCITPLADRTRIRVRLGPCLR